jgi:hypothetical protein
VTIDSATDSQIGRELERAPVPVAGPVRAIEARLRLLPALPMSRTAVVAAAGGFLAGAAALAAVRRAARTHKRLRRRGRRRDELPVRSVVASRSFLVDVHLLGR